MTHPRTLRLFQYLQRVNDQRHLHSMRTAFISTMPLMIAGAFAVAINNLPVPAYQTLLTNLLGDNWKLFGGLIYNATTQIVTLMVVFATCSNLATWYVTHKQYQLHTGICGFVGLACYVIVSIPISPDSLPFNMVGVTGLFIGLVVSLVATEAFVLISSYNKATRMLSTDPGLTVPLSFAAVKPTLLVLSGFALLRLAIVLSGTQDGLSLVLTRALAAPFQGSTDSIGTAQAFNITTHVMWLFGLHGNNVLDEVAKTIYVPAMASNVAAAAAGLPAPHLVTKTLFDVFVYMGGSGTTLALLLALILFGKKPNNRSLLRYALPTAIFNINEPLIFGIPIVLNPVYAIPFVLTPVLMFTTTSIAMLVGLVPYTSVDVSWATPVFISGYMATKSIAGLLLQVFNLGLGVLVYLPFVKVSERMSQMRFERAYSDLCDLISTDYSSARRLIKRPDEVGAVARQLANQLDDAVPEVEMYLHYQPIVDSCTNTMHSVEALLRWKHPLHGMINPMLIIALAEETGRINKLGLWIVEQALIQRAEWTQQGMGDFHVSVNVSTHQLNMPDLHEKIAYLLQKYNVPPHQLQIEITETAALVENENTRSNLDLLNKLGVSIAMDDFGVGHSSLLYLRTQPITTLKIDGSLSREIIKHPANLDIISTIYDLCKLLQVDTIIEFVDNPEQLERLKSIGAFLIQGYYFSPPIPGNQIPTFSKDVQTSGQ